MTDRQDESTVSSARPSIIRNADGTYTRLIQFPSSPANSDADGKSPVLSKDIPLNSVNQTWLRIYVPRRVPSEKLPLIVYFHGGGFVFGSSASTLSHDFCVGIATYLPAVVVSIDYRLAPEHRLPAAYEDAVDALHLIKSSEDSWLTGFADVANCFLMGTSAGGNIAYHAGLHAAAAVDELRPLKINGLILHHPFFGGSDRTGSELALADDPMLNMAATDQLWELTLPVGVNRDHEFCNPTVGSLTAGLERVRLNGWRVLVTGRNRDPLIDRQVELAKMLKVRGVLTVENFDEGHHAMEVWDPSKAKELFVLLQEFLSFHAVVSVD